MYEWKLEQTYMGRNYLILKRKRFLLKSVIAVLTVGICAFVSVYIISFLLGPPKLLDELNTIYFDDTGDVIGEEKGSESRYWVDLDDISSHVVDAMIAIEDKRFYKHSGFDSKRMIQAVLSNLRNLSLKEGASTLTQQYARNLFLSHEKTWSRKIKEAFYTVRLEMYYSKEEILEGYLNTIYFGHGAYGIEAASRHFFNKSADELTRAEATMLVAIPKGPTYYSPLNDPEKAKERQKHILNAMHRQQVITNEEHFLTARENLTYAKHTEKGEINGSYFQDTVLQEAGDILNTDSEQIKSGGYQIYTTLRSNFQEKLEQNIAHHIDNRSEIEVGAVAMNPKTGGIKALVGGQSYEQSPFNRAIKAKRMSGSTFKPFLYYTALENGYTASTMLMSQPTAFSLENGEVYKPSNFNGYYANQSITLAQALALSDNVYAVKTNLFLGVDQLIETARNFGITSELPSVPSLALGTSSVTVEEMVAAYGMLANGGQQIKAYTIKKIMDRHGTILYERDDKDHEQILDPVHTFIMNHLLTGMFDQALDGYMSVTGSTIADQLTRPYAGKSGTTNSDSWMIGYSPTLVSGIWTGYDDNRPMENVAETAYAKDVWADFMEAAHQDKPVENFTAPPGVVGVQIDPTTGQIATSYCPDTYLMYFKEGTEPTEHCMTHFPNGNEHPETKQDEEEKGIFRRLFDFFM